MSSPAIYEDAIKNIEDKSYVYQLVSEDESSYEFKKLEVLTGQKDENLIMIKTDEPIEAEAWFLRNL